MHHISSLCLLSPYYSLPAYSYCSVSDNCKRMFYSDKRQRSSDRGSESPTKLMRMGELPDVANEHEYRKRKIRHSITEPLDRKKHLLDVPEPEAGTSRASEPGYVSEEESRPRKKAKSLHDYPTRRSARPTLLESIQEMPEVRFRVQDICRIFEDSQYT